MADAKTAIIYTSMGPIRLELYSDRAPKTVRNFVELAEGTKAGALNPRTGQPISGPYYEGTEFHRVIDGFMIQTGDPTSTGNGDPGYQFDDEPHPELTFYRPFLLAMANAGKLPDGSGTNGSQFFITVAPCTYLNFKHTIFGKVADAESEQVVLEISKVPVDGHDRPNSTITVYRIDIGR